MIEQHKVKLSFLAITFLLLFNNWSIPLWDQDESAYAGFAYNMIEEQNWLVPDFPFSDVHRKPPLHFWNIAVFNKIFGYNTFALRFSSVLAVLGTLLLLYFQGRKFFSERTALIAVWVLAGSFLVTAIAKVAVTDAKVLFFSTLCAFGLLNVLHFKSKWWVFWFWLGIAAGVLVKGPPVLMFAGMFGLLLLVFHPKRWNFIQLHPWFFLPISLLPFTYWAYLTYQHDGGVFLNWMLDWYVLKRIDGHVFGQTGPVGMHILGLLAFFVLFIRFIPLAIWNGLRAALRKDDALLITALWWIAGWFFYEFSPSKLPAYVIAAHVPFAIFLAHQIAGYYDENKSARIFSIVQFFIFYSLSLGLILAQFLVEIPAVLGNTLLILGVYVFLWTSILFWKLKSEYYNRIHLLGAFGFVLLAWTLAPWATNAVNSSKRIADSFQSNGEKVQVVIATNYGNQPSMPYYLMAQGFKVSDETKTPIEEIVSQFSGNAQTAFVLSRAQFDFFTEFFDKEIPHEHIQTLMIDRKGRTDYFIVSSKDLN
jgi:4-amino-4-deoxy-L-arabinose transferase-like glycosyltransferase